MARLVGWYRLPRSGHPFFGPIPDGAEVIEEPVDGSHGGAQVGSDVLADEKPSKAKKVATRPSAPAEEAVDGDVLGGQDPEATP